MQRCCAPRTAAPHRLRDTGCSTPHCRVWPPPRCSGEHAAGGAPAAASSPFRVRTASGAADNWRAARIHRRIFFPNLRDGEPLARFIEWDRALGLTYVDASLPKGARHACLVATAPPDAAAQRRWTLQQQGDGSRDVAGDAAVAAEDEAALSGGVEISQHGDDIVAVASLETLPSRFVRRSPGWPWPLPSLPSPGAAAPAGGSAAAGAQRELAQQQRAAGPVPRGLRVAYVSNLCVVPSARRRGAATQLLAAAEATAQEWGCTGTALHCNCADATLLALYRRRGYRHVATEPEWAPPLQLRATRLTLLLKRLPRAPRRSDAAEP